MILITTGWESKGLPGQKRSAPGKHMVKATFSAMEMFPDRPRWDFHASHGAFTTSECTVTAECLALLRPSIPIPVSCCRTAGCVSLIFVSQNLTWCLAHSRHLKLFWKYHVREVKGIWSDIFKGTAGSNFRKYTLKKCDKNRDFILSLFFKEMAAN